MQFKNLKASEFEGRVDLPGLVDWVAGLSGKETALLIPAPAGTGKTAAVGAIAHKMEHDGMQCDLLQVFRYPDSREALRSILAIVQNLRSIVFQADGIDRLGERFLEAGDASAVDEVSHWLADNKATLLERGVTFVATGRKLDAVSEDLRSHFDSIFVPGR